MLFENELSLKKFRFGVFLRNNILKQPNHGNKTYRRNPCGK